MEAATTLGKVKSLVTCQCQWYCLFKHSTLAVIGAGIFHRVANGLSRLRDVLCTYEHFDSRGVVTYGEELGVANLTCRTPSGVLLFRGLTLRVRRHESLLIMGPSGSGACVACTCLCRSTVGWLSLLSVGPALARRQ